MNVFEPIDTGCNDDSEQPFANATAPPKPTVPSATPTATRNTAAIRPTRRRRTARALRADGERSCERAGAAQRAVRAAAELVLEPQRLVFGRGACAQGQRRVAVQRAD